MFWIFKRKKKEKAPTVSVSHEDYHNSKPAWTVPTGGSAIRTNRLVTNSGPVRPLQRHEYDTVTYTSTVSDPIADLVLAEEISTLLADSTYNTPEYRAPDSVIQDTPEPVSYTHLTLPTILRV